jgi:hypothetical protein
VTEPATTDPTASEPTLEQQIIDAGKELSAAIRARPRDQARIDAARAELERLKALADGQA